MDLVSYALVSLDNTKSFLGITSSQHDEVLKLLINQATDYIETVTGRRFTETEYTNEEHDGHNCKTINLDNFPVTSTTTFKLEENNAADNSDNWEEIDTDNYWVDNDEGIVTYIAKFLKGKQNYRATYSAGYTTIPYDIQFLCMSLVSAIFSRRKSMGIRSESLGDRDVTFMSSINQDSQLANIISNYRKIPL